jgi:hypothetical protein
MSSKQLMLDELTSQVRRNCLVSDARFWGFYSICGLLMRLRELYRFESGLGPGKKIEQSLISEWIGQREALWEEMQGMELSLLEINGKEFDPFDSIGINEILVPEGLLYGAGYGIYMKPVFFLTELDGVEAEDGCRIYLSGREHARDLSIHPAMLQGKTIFARKYAAEVLINEKFDEFKASKNRGLLWRAFSAYGLDRRSSREKVGEVATAELRSYISHELGEAHETRRLGPQWGTMLLEAQDRRTAAYLRALKDILADTTERGMLKHIIENRKAGSIAFYISFMSGPLRPIAIKLHDSYEAFLSSGRWEAIDSARKECYAHARSMSSALLEVYGSKGDAQGLQDKIKKQISMISPLSS